MKIYKKIFGIFKITDPSTTYYYTYKHLGVKWEKYYKNLVKENAS